MLLAFSEIQNQIRLFCNDWCCNACNNFPTLSGNAFRNRLGRWCKSLFFTPFLFIVLRTLSYVYRYYAHGVSKNDILRCKKFKNEFAKLHRMVQNFTLHWYAGNAAFCLIIPMRRVKIWMQSIATFSFSNFLEMSINISCCCCPNECVRWMIGCAAKSI